MRLKQGQWHKSDDHELHYFEDKWILTIVKTGEKHVLPLELMSTIHFAVSEILNQLPSVEIKTKKWWQL